MPACATSALLAIFGLALAASRASAQDVFALFGDGAEAKLNAGAGAIAAYGAPASFYAPANLVDTEAELEPYVSLDVARLAYEYTYPGYDTVAVESTVPLPFFGLTWKPVPTVAVAGSLLPIPSGSGTQKIEDLPTRKFTSEPILVDVETGGGGKTGVRASLGAAWEPTDGLAVGASVLYSAGSGSFAARDTLNDAVMASEESSSTRLGAMLSARGRTWRGRVTGALVVHLPSTTRTRGSLALPALTDATLDQTSTRKGPLGLTAAAELRSLPVMPTLAPFVEVTHERWSALRSQKTRALVEKTDTDYFDTTDVAVGLAWQIAPAHRVNAAYGAHQSHLGDGIVADESDDGQELVGMEFQDMDALPYTTVAAGYRHDAAWGRLSAGVSSLRGARDVWSKARGFGRYELSVLTVVAGAALAL